MKMANLYLKGHLCNNVSITWRWKKTILAWLCMPENLVNIRRNLDSKGIDRRATEGLRHFRNREKKKTAMAWKATVLNGSSFWRITVWRKGAGKAVMAMELDCKLFCPRQSSLRYCRNYTVLSEVAILVSTKVSKTFLLFKVCRWCRNLMPKTYWMCNQ